MRQRPTSDDFRRSDKGDATEGRVPFWLGWLITWRRQPLDSSEAKGAGWLAGRVFAGRSSDRFDKGGEGSFGWVSDKTRETVRAVGDAAARLADFLERERVVPSRIVEVSGPVYRIGADVR